MRFNNFKQQKAPEKFRGFKSKLLSKKNYFTMNLFTSPSEVLIK